MKKSILSPDYVGEKTLELVEAEMVEIHSVRRMKGKPFLYEAEMQKLLAMKKDILGD